MRDRGFSRSYASSSLELCHLASGRVQESNVEEGNRFVVFASLIISLPVCCPARWEIYTFRDDVRGRPSRRAAGCCLSRPRQCWTCRP